MVVLYPLHLVTPSEYVLLVYKYINKEGTSLGIMLRSSYCWPSCLVRDVPFDKTYITANVHATLCFPDEDPISVLHLEGTSLLSKARILHLTVDDD